MGDIEDRIYEACETAARSMWMLHLLQSRFARCLNKTGEIDQDLIDNTADILIEVWENGLSLEKCLNNKDVSGFLDEANPYPAAMADDYWATSYTGAVYDLTYRLCEIVYQARGETIDTTSEHGQVIPKMLSKREIVESWVAICKGARQNYAGPTEDLSIHVEKEKMRAIRLSQAAKETVLADTPPVNSRTRHRAAPCPKCQGKTKITSSQPDARYQRCCDCGHRFKSER